MFRSMRPALLRPAATVLVLAGFALGGIPATGAEASESPLQPGAWALQCRITNNFTLGSFEGSWISVKKHRSERTAYRLGLSLEVDDQGTESTTSQTGFDDRTSDVDFTRWSLSAELQLLRYAAGDRAVRPFIGGGPFLDRSYRESTRVDDGPRQRSLETTWSFGASTLLGVEWTAADWLGVHVEYGVAARYTLRDSESTTYHENEPPGVMTRTEEMDGWSVYGRGVLFGLSVYF